MFFDFGVMRRHTRMFGDGKFCFGRCSSGNSRQGGDCWRCHEFGTLKSIRETGGRPNGSRPFGRYSNASERYSDANVELSVSASERT